MTMVVGCNHQHFGLLAFDSRHGVNYSDGSFAFEDGHPPALASLPEGWVAHSGYLSIHNAVVEELRGASGGSLAELTERLMPVLERAASEVRRPRQDPTTSRTFVLTGATGTLELGILTARDGLQRIPAGNRTFSSPGGMEFKDARARWEKCVAESTPLPSGYALFRSLASLSHDLAARTPSVAGYLHAGILQRRGPGAPWQVVKLEGASSEIAEASDHELSNMLREEVAA